MAECHGGSLPTSRPLRYLDLGYGTGVSLNINAAASPGEYWGTDINPLHADSARALAAAAGTGVRALDGSFAALLERSDLPRFDVVVAHGVWSWVSEENRAVIAELLRRHLADGGVYCMNTLAMPGSAEMVPFQRLMRLQRQRSRLDAADAVRGGLSLARALRAAGSGYFAPSSPAGRLLQSLRWQPAGAKDGTLSRSIHRSSPTADSTMRIIYR
jgi:SAM-dependent methyltransferase